MRGYVFMLEALLAGLLLVGFMAYLSGSIPKQAAFAEADFSHILPGLDDGGSLRELAYSGDAPGIEDSVNLPGFAHSVQLCYPSGGCQGQALSEGNTMVFPYLLAGDSSFSPLEVRLYAAPA